jgi:hypothetical protein
LLSDATGAAGVPEAEDDEVDEVFTFQVDFFFSSRFFLSGFLS